MWCSATVACVCPSLRTWMRFNHNTFLLCTQKYVSNWNIFFKKFPYWIYTKQDFVSFFWMWKICLVLEQAINLISLKIDSDTGLFSYMSPMYIPGLTSSRWPLVPGLTHSSLWSSEAGGVSYLPSPSRGISARRCTPVLLLERHEKHKELNRYCSFRSSKNYLQKR